ncbi:MAG TPA: hypothetical protein VEX39_14105 [Thermoleophilaceae bacterium]|nr:hypothetical protein [Thermoleophilaceae bacterium]
MAMIAALVLLFVMAMDWYSSTVGERAREVEKLSEPTGGSVADQTQRENQESAREAAQAEEKTAWQAPGLIDKLILVGLLGTIVLAVAGAWLRAAGRRFEPPSTPSTATAVVATMTGLLVAYRIIQEPGFDETTTVKAGAPLALVVLGVIALASRESMRRENAGTAWKEEVPA